MNGDKIPRLSRSFLWLNVTQFLGALNDNLYKLLIVFLLVAVQGDAHKASIVATASAVFVAPFLLFSHAGGVLADRFSKRTVIVCMKLLEILIMLLGLGAALGGRAWGLYGVLFLMCTHSALFGPSKYGIVPELVGPTQLTRANSRLVGLTYLAIIVGTFVPSFLLLKVLHRSFAGLALVCVGVAVTGTLAALGIERTPAQGGRSRFRALFVVDLARTVRSLAGDRHLLLTVLGAAYFTFLGAFMQQNLMLYGADFLKLEWIACGYLFPVAALGIGVGALAAGRLSGRSIEFGIVPLGALGLTAVNLALGWVRPEMTTVLALIFLVGVSSGLFVVPLDAFVQYRSPPARRGEILACCNFLGFLGVALSAALLVFLTRVCGLAADRCFTAIGGLTGVLALAAMVVLPDFFVRFVIILVTRCFYRIRVVGFDHLPEEGGALLVSNHVTWVDALLISATTQRRIRFVMAREIAGNRWLRPLFRLMDVIPVSPRDGPREVLTALKEARRALEDGRLVCIFAEGALTRNGNLQPFKAGLERIVRGTAFPIVPVCIGGAWGSIFSYYHGRLLSAFPKALPYPVTVEFGAPLPAATRAPEVRQAVLELLGHAFDLQKNRRRSLPHALVRVARAHWFRVALADSTGRRLTYGRALAGAAALARELDRLAPGQDAVGILLPASVGGALANMAVTLTGRTAVNLNSTTARPALESAVAQAKLRTILSSRAFLERLGYAAPPAGTVCLEDLAARLGAGARARAWLRAAFAPAGALMTHRRPGPDDVAAVIFSSGSTGQPKGIMLTHHNILSNLEGFRMVVRFREADGMCGVLPFFHSFGYTCTLWCPLLTPFRVVYHGNPLDGGRIGELVRANRLTILLATPTFLLAYVRKAERADFASLRLVIVGAEKLKDATARAFEDAFGLRPLEGYGATEIAPVGSISVDDVACGGMRQTGAKPGSVGHPIPGVTMRVVDAETGAPVAAGTEGLLQVKGPNVMAGYLDQPARTAEVLRDGWYRTGDVARLDGDGFVFLTGRLSRFSKIGGEMVPHVAVEEKVLTALGKLHAPVVVSSAEDARKGEQLVVFYTDEAGDVEALAQALRASDLPNLWKPRRENLVRIDALPTLGSGKLDLQAIKALAQQHVTRP